MKRFQQFLSLEILRSQHDTCGVSPDGPKVQSCTDTTIIPRDAEQGCAIFWDDLRFPVDVHTTARNVLVLACSMMKMNVQNLNGYEDLHHDRSLDCDRLLDTQS